MPVISMTLGTGQTTEDQKSEFIKQVTQNASQIFHIPEQAFTILIQEIGADSIGIGGKTLKEVRASRD